MSSLLQDVRYAFRQLCKSPAFTVTVVVTLALGLGANAAVFTLFDRVLLRMLPVERPRELVRFEWTGGFSGSASSFGGDMNNYFSYPMYKDLRDKSQAFSGVLAADRTKVGISWHNRAEQRDAEIVSGNYFQVLGLQPAAGRLFTQEDDTAKNANPVVVLSYDYWRTNFAASGDVVGQAVLINGHSFTIVGIAPASFHSAIGGYRPGLFLPVSMEETAMSWMTPRDNLNNHQSLWLTVVARLKPGVAPAQAEASLAPLWHSLREYELTLYKQRSEHFKKQFLDNSRLQVKDDSTGFMPERLQLRKPLLILMSMATLLVAMCAINVATLLLLRATGRAREMSMRYALGAKRARIVSQLLVEGLMLGLAGAAVGLAMAPMVAGTLAHLMTDANLGQEPFSTAIDARVLLFTFALSVAVSLLFCLAPTIHFLRPNLAVALRQNAGTATKGSQRFRKIAVGAQIGLSVLLLGGAGLFLHTLNNLRHEVVGFDIGKLVTFTLDPTISGYGEDRTPFVIGNALNALRSIPGVTTVSATDDPELTGDSNRASFTIQGFKAGEDEQLHFEEPWISPDYFATLHQPLLAGREFTLADAQTAPKVAVVNVDFAKRFFGSAQNALGRSLGEGRGADVKLDTTIVGVVGGIKHSDLRTDIGPAVYRAYFQQSHPGGVKIYLRTASSPEMVESAVRRTVHQLDGGLVVADMRTMETQVASSASDERALAYLAAGFACLALLLAAVGLYGVLAYSTEQRTREIGVRLALGAQRSGVVMLVVREMALIAAIATATGLPSVVALARLFRSQLYGVTTFDPLTLSATVLLTAAMVTMAAALPARRAATVEPVRALRIE